MTRKKEIDREKVLDAAEAVIIDSDGRSFTLDAVAERAGISKGGLVYTFGTKDELIHAALEREVGRFREAVRQRLGDRPLKAAELVLAHIDEALNEDYASTKKAAFLVTALVHAPDMLEPVKELYRSLFEPLTEALLGANEIRRSLLAVEGAFLLQGLGLAEISPSEMKAVLLHARNVVFASLAEAVA
ncbi:TetR/AcrR family transcriptional regulator [Herbaspirillum frisingense]|uniref:TetR/AcrR family transcriptional regulator n=1 Tax=Herbaspirillum frisingense TaxID=92645 RepID=UPI001602D1A6|nr:TetR/AcrR family transcriptional regulator [Herbaspirillum frisingense]QNB08641.1 TetR/AcrR family transcriptional regulator [Herbaspirillum frisingense]